MLRKLLGPAAVCALAWIVLCSLIYYGWFKPIYLLLLGFSVGFNFGLGIPLSRAAQTPRGKLLLVLGVIVNLGLLGYFKYAGFFVDTAAYLAGATWKIEAILLPIGVSFFTFQQIAYLVDTYRKETHEYHFVDYALFVTFFPQLIAGPIVHHKEVLPQFEKPYSLTSRDMSVGLTIFLFGLGKKVLIADEVGGFATPVFQAADSGLTLAKGKQLTFVLRARLLRGSRWEGRFPPTDPQPTAVRHVHPRAKVDVRAGDGIRTHDNNLGNVVLCQLSYTRTTHRGPQPQEPRNHRIRA